MLLLLVYGLFLVVAALWLLRAAVYLVIGAGYVLVYGTTSPPGMSCSPPAGCSGSSAGWVSVPWTGRSMGAPPIAARWHQWRDSRAVTAPVTAERRPPVKEIGVVLWGYGHLNLARTKVRELPARRSSSVAHR